MWTFFPLHAVHGGICGCSEGVSCERAGKHPSIPWANLSPGEQVEGPAGAGRGIVTGAKSGVFVLDVDVKPGKDGFVTLEKLGPIPATYTVETPTGGKHFYFLHPGRPVRTSGGALAPGLDIRGDGGFVVAPGSPHRNGGTYRVDDPSPIASAPAWLLEWPGLYPTERVEGGTGPTPISPTHPRWGERLLMADAACKTYAPSQEGGEAASCLGRIVKRLIWDLELPRALAAEKIATIWDARCTRADGFTPYPWGEAEIERAIANSLSRDFTPGVAPANWLENFVADLQKPTPAPEVSRRRTARPEHVYTCALGDVPNGDKATTDISNIISILVGHPDWEGVLQYDELKGRVRAVDPPIKLAAESPNGLADTDITSIRTWFACAGGLLVPKEAAWDAVLAAAHKNAYNPVADWLESLPLHDGPSLFDGLSAQLFGGSPSPLYDTFLRKFMVAAVRRALIPGSKVDTMLVLQAPKQGDGKSTFAHALFGEEWFAEDLQASDLGHKDNAQALATTWAVELAELDKLLRNHATSVKSFLSRRVDTYRPSYGRSIVNRPRQCVFVGTTNETDFLQDPSGSRRFWCIPVKRQVPPGWIESHREALWAEAYALHLAGEQHWLTPAEEAARETDAEQFGQEEVLADPLTALARGKEFVKLADAIRVLQGTDPSANQHRVVRALKTLGYVPGFFGPELARFRAWKVPALVAAMPTEKKFT